MGKVGCLRGKAQQEGKAVTFFCGQVQAAAGGQVRQRCLSDDGSRLTAAQDFLHGPETVAGMGTFNEIKALADLCRQGRGVKPAAVQLSRTGQPENRLLKAVGGAPCQMQGKAGRRPVTGPSMDFMQGGTGQSLRNMPVQNRQAQAQTIHMGKLRMDGPLPFGLPQSAARNFLFGQHDLVLFSSVGRFLFSFSSLVKEVRA